MSPIDDKDSAPLAAREEEKTSNRKKYVPPHLRRQQRHDPSASASSEATNRSKGPSDRLDSGPRFRYHNQEQQQGGGGYERTDRSSSNPHRWTKQGRGPTATRTNHRQNNQRWRNNDQDNRQRQSFEESYQDQREGHDTADQLVLRTAFDAVFGINLPERHDKWQTLLRRVQSVDPSRQPVQADNDKGSRPAFADQIVRFEAVRGQDVLDGNHPLADQLPRIVQLKWDATKNAKFSKRVHQADGDLQKTMSAGEVGCAFSHVQLWKRLLELRDQQECDTVKSNPIMLILEDDIVFTKWPAPKGRSSDRFRNTPNRHSVHRFVSAFAKAWRQLPDDWSILYLGFSSRGERFYVTDDQETANTKETRNSPVTFDAKTRDSRRSVDNDDDLKVRIYRPTYGFHTHAYAINAKAASTLLEHLPVVGPIDVWLADNAWFGLRVYAAVIANEGWQLDDGSYEGTNLISQDRQRKPGSRQYSSDIQQSAHLE